MTQKDNKIGAEKLEAKGKIKMTIGKYNVRCSYKIVGLTDSAIEDFNKLLAKGENNERLHTEQS